MHLRISARVYHTVQFTRLYASEEGRIREGCGADLDEAWEIAERGPMRLHMADVQLTRARLFRDRQALEAAAELIEKCGYRRREGELEDAREMMNDE